MFISVLVTSCMLWCVHNLDFLHRPFVHHLQSVSTLEAAQTHKRKYLAQQWVIEEKNTIPKLKKGNITCLVVLANATITQLSKFENLCRIHTAILSSWIEHRYTNKQEDYEANRKCEYNILCVEALWTTKVAVIIFAGICHSCLIELIQRNIYRITLISLA